MTENDIRSSLSVTKNGLKKIFSNFYIGEKPASIDLIDFFSLAASSPGLKNDP
jgi:hypothetical protein